MTTLAEKHFAEFDIENMTQKQIVSCLKGLQEKVEKRREICRKSSAKYYKKTFSLPADATKDDIEKNKNAIKKRDDYQSSYYEKNKEAIKQRQRDYRARKKAEKQKTKEKEVAETLANLKND